MIGRLRDLTTTNLFRGYLFFLFTLTPLILPIALTGCGGDETTRATTPTGDEESDIPPSEAPTPTDDGGENPPPGGEGCLEGDAGLVEKVIACVKEVLGKTVEENQGKVVVLSHDPDRLEGPPGTEVRVTGWVVGQSSEAIEEPVQMKDLKIRVTAPVDEFCVPTVDEPFEAIAERTEKRLSNLHAEFTMPEAGVTPGERAAIEFVSGDDDTGFTRHDIFYANLKNREVKGNLGCLLFQYNDNPPPEPTPFEQLIECIQGGEDGLLECLLGAFLGAEKGMVWISDHDPDPLEGNGTTDIVLKGTVLWDKGVTFKDLDIAVVGPIEEGSCEGETEVPIVNREDGRLGHTTEFEMPSAFDALVEEGETIEVGIKFTKDGDPVDIFYTAHGLEAIEKLECLPFTYTRPRRVIVDLLKEVRDQIDVILTSEPGEGRLPVDEIREVVQDDRETITPPDFPEEGGGGLPDQVRELLHKIGVQIDAALVCFSPTFIEEGGLSEEVRLLMEEIETPAEGELAGDIRDLLENLRDQIIDLTLLETPEEGGGLPDELRILMEELGKQIDLTLLEIPEEGGGLSDEVRDHLNNLRDPIDVILTSEPGEGRLPADEILTLAQDLLEKITPPNFPEEGGVGLSDEVRDRLNNLRDQIDVTLLCSPFITSGPGGGFDDQDDDGITDPFDNCVTTPNTDQTDTDEDGFGDACDVCPGGDDTVDTDGDGIPDACDPLTSVLRYFGTDPDDPLLVGCDERIVIEGGAGSNLTGLRAQLVWPDGVIEEFDLEETETDPPSESVRKFQTNCLCDRAPLETLAPHMRRRGSELVLDLQIQITANGEPIVFEYEGEVTDSLPIFYLPRLEDLEISQEDPDCDVVRGLYALIPNPEELIQLAPGLQAEVLTADLEGPGLLAISPTTGDIYVSVNNDNLPEAYDPMDIMKVTLDGKATLLDVSISDLDGLAFTSDGVLYATGLDETGTGWTVWEVDTQSGEKFDRGANLFTALNLNGLATDEDGKSLIVSVNRDDAHPEEAGIYRFNPQQASLKKLYPLENGWYVKVDSEGDLFVIDKLEVDEDRINQLLSISDPDEDPVEVQTIREGPHWGLGFDLDENLLFSTFRGAEPGKRWGLTSDIWVWQGNSFVTWMQGIDPLGIAANPVDRSVIVTDYVANRIYRVTGIRVTGSLQP